MRERQSFTLQPRRGPFSLILVAALLIAVFAPATVSHAQTSRPADPTVSAYEGRAINRSTTQATTAAKKELNGFDWQRLILAMVVVLGVIFALRALAAKYVPGMAVAKSSKAVRVLSRTPVSPRQQIMLLQVGKRVIVVGEQAGQMAPLSEITDPDEIATLIGQVENEAAATPQKPFAAMFRKKQEEFDAPVELSIDQNIVFEPSIEKPERQIEETQDEISGLIRRMRSLSQTMNRDK